VLLTWRAAPGDGPSEYSLTGRRQQTSWPVWYVEIADGLFQAVDNAEILAQGGALEYRLQGRTGSGELIPLADVTVELDVAPPAARLLLVAPNPSNPQTTVRFELLQPDTIRLCVFDTAGRLVKTVARGLFPPGEHGVNWNGTDATGCQVASGLYYVCLESSSGRDSTKFMMLR